jgi:ribonuclease P protein component
MLSVWVLPNHLTVTRLGLRVGRGLKGSVVRNRAKRLVREVFRAHKAELKIGDDLLIVIHQIAGVSLKQFEAELLEACLKLRLFN